LEYFALEYFGRELALVLFRDFAIEYTIPAIKAKFKIIKLPIKILTTPVKVTKSPKNNIPKIAIGSLLRAPTIL
jgi:hypothetical protein